MNLDAIPIDLKEVKSVVGKLLPAKYFGYCNLFQYGSEGGEAIGSFIVTEQLAFVIPALNDELKGGKRTLFRGGAGEVTFHCSNAKKGITNPPPEFAQLPEAHAGGSPTAWAMSQSPAHITVDHDGMDGKIQGSKALIRVNFERKHVFIPASIFRSLVGIYGTKIEFRVLDGSLDAGPAGRVLVTALVTGLPVAMILPIHPEPIQKTIEEFIRERDADEAERTAKPKGKGKGKGKKAQPELDIDTADASDELLASEPGYRDGETD